MKSSPGFHRIHGASVAATVVLLLALSGPLRAADAPARQPSGPDTAAPALEEITVTGIRKSLQDAISEKRNGVQVIDAISARTSGNSPTRTWAKRCSA